MFKECFSSGKLFHLHIFVVSQKSSESSERENAEGKSFNPENYIKSIRNSAVLNFEQKREK